MMDRESTKITLQDEKYRPLEGGFYLARLIAYSLKKGKYAQDVFLISFEIIKGDKTGRFVRGLINKSENGKNGKLWQLASAMVGEKIQVGSEFFVHDLLEKECFIGIEKVGGNNAITEYVSKRYFDDIGSSRFQKKL